MAATERTVREKKRASALVGQFGIDLCTAIAIARVELECEARLVATLRSARADIKCWLDAFGYESHAQAVAELARIDSAVAAYEAEFAPPQRTVEEIARDLVASRAPIRPHPEDDRNDAVPSRLLDELAAALKKGGA